MTDKVRMPKRFDYSSNVEFNSALAVAMQNNREVTIDCSEMDYIDSAGIGLLVMANKTAQHKNVKLVLKNLRSTPLEILQLANIQKIIEIR